MRFPKYSHLEIERRWLVELAALDFLASQPFRLIEDLYLQESRLRLRKMTSEQTLEYKLCKKYGKTDDYSEPICNFYLNQSEYDLLNTLPGSRIVKRRYTWTAGSIDLYLQPELEFAIFEIEFENLHAAENFSPPDFVRQEISNHSAYSGQHLALY